MTFILITARVHNMQTDEDMHMPNTRHDRKSPLSLHTFQFSLHHIKAEIWFSEMHFF